MAADGFNIPAGEAQPVYAAAAQGRRLRIWRPQNAGPNTVTTGALSLILRRARQAARNDPWAGTALDKLTSNGIGTGIQCKPLWGSEKQRLSIKRLWNRWAKVSDADGVMDFYGQQGLAWRSWHEAGEVFIRLRDRKASDGLPVPLQIQLIEAEQCPACHWATAPNGNPIRAGIEFNGIGRRVAYWMYRAHPGDALVEVGDNELVRVPAEQIIHVFQPDRPGQIRGVPRSASVLVRMFNLDSLDDAVLERQKIANLFAGFYTRDSSDSSDPNSLVDEMSGGETDKDGTPLAGLEPGTMQELPDGMKPEFSKPPDAGDNYASFMRGHLMAIAARHGVPYEVLTGDLVNVSDRALRLILNEFRRIIESWQWLVLIPQMLQPIREAWFDAAVLSGALSIARYADLREDVVETLWVPQGWPYSHPVQDVDADIKAIRAGLGSRAGVNLGHGEDPEQIDAENAADNARADALGLKYDSDGRQARSGAADPKTTKGKQDEP